MPWAEEDLGTTEGYSHELRDERTRHSRSYKQDDGDAEAVIYVEPVNFKNEQGQWQGIDNTLVPSSRSGYAYENKANSYTVYFPDDVSENPVRVESNGEWVTYSLEGASGAPVASGSTVTYSDALGGVDLSYTAQPTEVEEFLTLNDESAQQTFSFEIETSGETSIEEEADGGITLEDGTADPDFSFEPAYMLDSSSVTPDEVKPLDLAASGDTTVSLDASTPWLNDPERVWPIVIDPTVVASIDPDSEVLEPEESEKVSNDTFMLNANPNTRYDDNIRLKVGVTPGASGDTYRSLLRFPVRDAIGRGNIVVDAYMRLWVTGDDVPESEPPVDIKAYGVKANRAWNKWATWNNYRYQTGWEGPGGGEWDVPGVSTTAGDTEGNWEYWSHGGSPDAIDGLVQNWIGRRVKNQGFILKRAPAEDDKNVVVMYSANAGDASKRPSLHIEYEPLFVSYTADSFFQDKLPDTAPIDSRSTNYITFINDVSRADSEDPKNFFPNLRGLWPNKYGTAGFVTDSSDVPWTFCFGSEPNCAAPDDNGDGQPNEPAQATLKANGFRAPLELRKQLEFMGSNLEGTGPNSDMPVVVIDTANDYDVWAGECLVPTATTPTSLTCEAEGSGLYYQFSNGLHRLNPYAENTSLYPNFRSRGAIPPAMMIRRDEIIAGLIPHVLHLFWEETCTSEGYVHPMVKEESLKDGAGAEGMRIRIKPDSRLTPDLADRGLSPDELTIARALQDYGAYIGDNAGAGGTALKMQQDFEISPGVRYWDGFQLTAESFAGNLTWDDFEFVRAGYQSEILNPTDTRGEMC